MLSAGNLSPKLIFYRRIATPNPKPQTLNPNP